MMFSVQCKIINNPKIELIENSTIISTISNS